MLRRNDYQEALALRLVGKTYGEIRRVFGIPKSTLSVWFKNIQLPEEARKILAKKQSDGILALGEFNKKRTLVIQEENTQLLLSHKAKVKKLSSRELMLIGAALYWAEGYKNFKKGIYNHISFANSDPAMILLFVDFLEKIVGIKREEMKGCILIPPKVKKTDALHYWQDLTGIPRERFYVYSVLSRSSSRRRPGHLLPYGTLQVRVYRRREFFKIRGLIDGIVAGAGG